MKRVLVAASAAVAALALAGCGSDDGAAPGSAADPVVLKDASGTATVTPGSTPRYRTAAQAAAALEKADDCGPAVMPTYPLSGSTSGVQCEIVTPESVTVIVSQFTDRTMMLKAAKDALVEAQAAFVSKDDLWVAVVGGDQNTSSEHINEAATKVAKTLGTQVTFISCCP